MKNATVSPTAPKEGLREELLDTIRDMEKELRKMDGRNGSITQQIVDPEAYKEVEHFQNQFIIHNGQLDSLKHELKLRGVTPDQDPETLREYERLFDRLRSEFDDFSSRFN